MKPSLWHSVHDASLRAPHDAPDRPRTTLPPIDLTADELAAQLAEDPEFREWVGAEWLADVGAKMGRRP